MPAIVPILLLFNMLHPVQSFIAQPCVRIPKPSGLKYVTELGFNLMEIQTNESSLPHQLLVNPCVELEYYGPNTKLSRVYTLYGTCNFERIIRYTARIVTPYGCWKSELAQWNKPSDTGNCQRRQLNTTIFMTIRYHTRLILKTFLGPRRAGTAVLTRMTVYDDAKSDHNEQKYQNNYAKIVQCQCNRTGRPPLAEVWRRLCGRRFMLREALPDIVRLLSAVVIAGLAMCSVIIWTFQYPNSTD